MSVRDVPQQCRTAPSSQLVPSLVPQNRGNRSCLATMKSSPCVPGLPGKPGPPGVISDTVLQEIIMKISRNLETTLLPPARRSTNVTPLQKTLMTLVEGQRKPAPHHV